MEVKPGYKQTEVGVIPEDWEVLSFKELFNISAGGDVNLKRSSTEQDEFHCYPIYSNALTNKGLYGYCSYADHPLHTLTITARGTLGVATYRDHKYTAIGRVLVLEPKRKTAGVFFAEFINSRVKFAIESTGVPQLTAPQISNYQLAVPPYHEQRAIAEALSDVDGLLGGLDRLIAKKRDLKQAAMQQLLTGQTRLPGFHGEWVIKRLGEISTIATGNTPPTNDASNYGDEFLFVSPVDMGDTKFIKRTEKRLSSKGFAMSRRFPKGSILFVSIGSTIGKCGIATVELTSNQQINAIFPSPAFSVDYLFYAVCTAAPGIKAQAGEQAVPIVNKTQFAETMVSLPSLPEQTAIAAVLSDMDAELVALEQRREKTRALKQAMMQELLTGRTRLV
jgi:type I restriction enzyme S subunit